MDTGAASTTLAKDRNCSTDDDLSMLRTLQASLGSDRVRLYTYVLRHIEKYDKFSSHLKEVDNLCSSIDRLLDGDYIPSSDESGKQNTTLEDVMVESKEFRESLGEELVKCFTYVHSEEKQFNQYRIRYSAVVRLRNSLTDSNKTVDAFPKLTFPTPMASSGAKVVSKESTTNAPEPVMVKEVPDRTGHIAYVARVLGPAPEKPHISNVLLVRNPMKVSVAPNNITTESTTWNRNALVKERAKVEQNQDVPRFVGSEVTKIKLNRREGEKEDDRDSISESSDGEKSNDHSIMRDRSTHLSNRMTKRQRLMHQRAIATKREVVVEKVKAKPDRSAGDQEDPQNSALESSDELKTDDRDGKIERQKTSRAMYRPTIGEKVKTKHNRNADDREDPQDSISETSDESKSDIRNTKGGRAAGKNGGQKASRGMYKPTIATKREAMAEKQKTIYWRESVELSPIDFESNCDLFTRKYPKTAKLILTANKLAARKPVTLTIGIIRHLRKAYSVCAFCERDIDRNGDSMQAYDADKCRRHRFHRGCGAYARMVCPDRCLGCIIERDR